MVQAERINRDHSTLREEYDLSTLTLTNEFLKKKEIDHLTYAENLETEIKRLEAKIDNIDTQYLKWRKLARAEDCIQNIGLILEGKPPRRRHK